MTLPAQTWTDLANKALHDGQQALQQALQALLAAQTDLCLAQKAVETLEEEVRRVRKEANDKCTTLQEQINSLRLLAHMPEEEDDSIVQSVGPGASNAYVNQD